MKKHKTSIAGILMSVLLPIATTPMAEASENRGTLVIYNKNCTKVKGFKKHKRVTVHVYSSSSDSCTRTSVTIGQGEYKTVSLVPYWYDVSAPKKAKDCKYYHQAYGTVGGENDVRGDEGATVSCRKDWLGVCQCRKNFSLPR